MKFLFAMGTQFAAIPVWGTEGLREILDLRQLAWSYHYPDMSNKALQYLEDELDATSQHFTVYNQEGDLIAANRITFFNRADEIPTLRMLSASHLLGDCFAYFSRLVIHPAYRKLGIKELLDMKRSEVLLQSEAVMGVGLYGAHRLQDALKQGFNTLEIIEEGTELHFPFERRSIHIMCQLKTAAAAFVQYQPTNAELTAA